MVDGERELGQAGDGGSTLAAQLFDQMLRLPALVIVYAFDAMVRAMRESQNGVRVPRLRAPPDWNPLYDPGGTDGGLAAPPDGTFVCVRCRRRQEGASMRDQDLSGPDLKLVRYKILFTKRDYEYAFPEVEDIVSYATNATDFAGLKVAQFMCGLDTLPRPKLWRSKNYPKKAHQSGSPTIGEIPPEDHKYVKIFFEVLARYEKEDEDSQVQILREISEKIA